MNRWPSSTARSCTRRSRSSRPPPAARNRQGPSCGPPRPLALGRSPRAGPPVGREAQAVGHHPGPDRRDPRAGKERLHDPHPLADRRARREEERGRGEGGAGRLPDVRDRRPEHTSGSRPRFSSGNWAWSTRVRLSRRASRRFRARRSAAVAFIQPILDPSTRTVEVRFDVENPGRRLRPGMFATVTLKTPVADTPAFQSKFAARPAHSIRCTRPT